MIGIDTNVLVRFIVQDDPAQSGIANDFISSKISSENPGYINAIVLCEVVWVLRRAYHYQKAVLCSVIEQILSTRELAIEKSDAARSALRHYRSGEGDFSDYYIAISNRMASCSHTVTFDRKAGDHPDFMLI